MVLLIMSSQGKQMSNLSVFDFENNQVRVIMINGEPWFFGKEIAQALGYADTKQALRINVDVSDTLRVSDIVGCTRTTLPELQDVPFSTILINEAGMYKLVFSSRLDSAKRFKDWVAGEVLPTLRKTGSYSMTKEEANNSSLLLLDKLNDLLEKQATYLKKSEALDKLEKAAKEHPGCYNILEKFSEEELSAGITAQQYLIAKNLSSWGKKQTFAKRAASAMRVGKHVEKLPTLNGNVIYFSDDIAYLEETLKQMLGL